MTLPQNQLQMSGIVGRQAVLGKAIASFGIRSFAVVLSTSTGVLSISPRKFCASSEGRRFSHFAHEERVPNFTDPECGNSNKPWKHPRPNRSRPALTQKFLY